MSIVVRVVEDVGSTLLLGDLKFNYTPIRGSIIVY